jgi:hypothetical protein
MGPVTSSETPPLSPGWWQLLIRVNPAGRRWPGALQSAIAMVLPAAVVLGFGLETEMLLIASGGYAVLYGAGQPYRTRWQVMTWAAVFLAAGQMAGAFVGTAVWPQIAAGGSRWWMLLIAGYTTLVAVVVAFMQNALRLPPPGGFFIVMTAGGATMLAKHDMNPVEVGLWAAVGGASAVAIGMLPALSRWTRHLPEIAVVEGLEKFAAGYAADPAPSTARSQQAAGALAHGWDTLADAGLIRGGRLVTDDPHDLVDRTLTAQLAVSRHNRAVGGTGATDSPRGQSEVAEIAGEVDLSRQAIPLARPTARYRVYRSLTLYSHATLTALKILVASLLAGVVGIALDLDRPDWAVVSAMLVLQWGPDRRPGTIRGIHRLIGSVFGILLFALFHTVGLHTWGLLLALGACQFFAELFVVRNYALTLVVTTPLAMLMGGAMNQPLGDVILSRSTEVVIAVLFSIAGLWLFFLRDAEVRHSRRLVDRSTGAMGALLGRLRISASPEQALAERRDLQYELLSERRAAQSTAYNAPEYAAAHWPRHLSVQHTGYALLDLCMTAGREAVPADRLEAVADTVRELTLPETDR